MELQTDFSASKNVISHRGSLIANVYLPPGEAKVREGEGDFAIAFMYFNAIVYNYNSKYLCDCVGVASFVMYINGIIHNLIV